MTTPKTPGSGSNRSTAFTPQSSTTGKPVEKLEIDELFKAPKVQRGDMKVRDIMAGVPQERLDPFLMWHELPRAYYAPGQYPGVPVHPHRGFYECPYMKEMTAETGTNTTKAIVRVTAEEKKYEMEPGHFELGRTGAGCDHQMIVDKRWSGILHYFQLWVNLPSSNKFDYPNFQNATPFALPILEFSDDARARILHGQVDERKAPCKCDAVSWQYLDFELAAGALVTHEAPAEMTTQMVYVYQGSGTFNGERVEGNHLAIFKGKGPLEAIAERKGLGFLWLAGQPIGESVIQHGPFVMNTRQQIQQCFEEYQQGKIGPKPITVIQYR